MKYFDGREVWGITGSLEPKVSLKIGRALLVLQQSLLFACDCFPYKN